MSIAEADVATSPSRTLTSTPVFNAAGDGSKADGARPDGISQTGRKMAAVDSIARTKVVTESDNANSSALLSK